MTTLYRPILIESAEQAEALPVGTVASPGRRDPRNRGPGRRVQVFLHGEGSEA